MARICLVTTSQPSANPRLVKEADALVAAGHDVHVVGAHWVDWATTPTLRWLPSRGWSFSFVDWRRAVSGRRSGGRLGSAAHGAASLRRDRPDAAGRGSRIDSRRARARAEVHRHPADLYIAHNLGALPIAIDAARRVGARVGFDAEDFHSGQLSPDSDRPLHSLTEAIERRPCRDAIT